MSKLGNLIVNVGANTKEFNKALGDVNREIGRTTGNIQKMGKQLSMAVTAPIALLAGSGLKVFMSFEAQMAKVQAVSGATAAEFKSLSENAKMLGSSTRFTASEVAELQTEFAKLGFSADEITKVTEATLALAQATDSDLATSAMVAGNTLRAFGLDASETTRVTDVMASSFSKSGLDMAAFAESMKHVAPVANSAGISIEQTTAMLAVLADSGIKGSQAGTALRRIISDLGSTSGDVAGELANMAERGLDLADAKDEVGRNAQSALLVLSKGVPQMKGLQGAFEGSAGAAKAMADIMDNTAEGAMKRMQSAIEGAQLTIGQALAPAMMKAMDGVSKLASGFANMSSSGQNSILVMGGIAAAIGPVLVIVPQLVKGFMLLRAGLVQSVIPAVMRLNAVLLANPYLLAAAGVAALTFAIHQVATAQTAAEIQQEKLTQKMAEAGREAGAQMAEVLKLKDAVEDETKMEDERLEALQKLQKISPAHFANLDLEKVKMGELTGAVDSYKKSLLETARVKALQKQLEEVTSELLAIEQGAQESGSSFARAIAWMSGDSEGLAKRLTKNQRNALLKQQDFLLEQLGDVKEAVDNVTEDVVENDDSFKPLGDSAVDATEKITDLEWALHNLGNIQLDMGGLKQRKQDQDMRGGDANIQEVDDFQDDEFNALGFTQEEVAQMTTAVDEFHQNHQDKLNTTLMLTESLSGAMGNMFGTMIDGSAEADEAMKTMGKSILKTMLGIAKAHAVAVFSSPANPANSLTGGMATPAVVAGGLALVEGLLGAIAFADGGIVSGPTLGMVGEYPGAKSNPEVIAPLDKLESMIGGGGSSDNITVVGKISGNDIELAREAGSNLLRRSRGGGGNRRR